ncbi:MAG TPA: UDP-N-acetylmuramate dehydrogenase [Candidatus Binatia bacterium]
MSTAGDHAPLAPELKKISGLKVKIGEPLARYTSMKVGGPADYFVEVENEAALAELLRLLNRHQESFWVLGNGSNVLISDRGVRGAIIRLGGEFKKVRWGEADTATVTAGAAVSIGQLARDAARRGCAGLEFAEGIPGSVGGALYMNAGAYDCEIEQIVDQVELMTAGGEPLCLAHAEMRFSYRDSHLPFGAVVMRVRMRLRHDEPGRVSARLRELARKRKASQPSGSPNSGSMFRNPPGDYAGRLIDAAGLKGTRAGACQISERHGNFIVNHGGAKAIDVRKLLELAKREVQKKFGIELVPEVKLLGDWESQ